MNHLATEHSPYLKEHKSNPVDWYPWGQEAFDRAKAEDKPIFLSIGYSTCHWCHVMRRESFEDHETARIMNDNFINIKVDREELPDVDATYMDVVQTLGLPGGWPLNVFLTPGLKPIYGGTYFPKKSRFGMPAFKAVLTSIADAYWNRKQEILQNADSVIEQIKNLSASETLPSEPNFGLLDAAYKNLEHAFDKDHGGFGRSPKFPNALTLEFLLKYYKRTKNEKALEMVEQSLRKMAQGGIFDQVAGGFHRYSVDVGWFLPHFEKMLYDNALLANVYIHAYQVTGNYIYKYVGERIIKYVLREMTSEEGGFYSGQDAESEDEEGKFYLWDYEELEKALSPEELEVARKIYHVSESGNYKGKNLLNQTGFERPFPPDIEHVNYTLLNERNKRIRPHIDDKVLSSWNSLMLSALANAAGALNNPEYHDAAVNNANFLLDNMLKNGQLYRSYVDGDAYVPAYLEDHSNFINALIDVYELTFDLKWLDGARTLAASMVEQFWDAERSQFFDSGPNHSDLIIRPRNIYDTPLPAGGSSASYALLRLSTLFDYSDWSEIAYKSLESVATIARDYPVNLSMVLSNFEWILSSPSEISIVGQINSEDMNELASNIRGRYIANRVLAMREPGQDKYDKISILKDKEEKDGKPTVYICERSVCKEAVNNVSELDRLIA